MDRDCLCPVVMEAMREVGIDLSSAKPQKLTKELAEHATGGSKVTSNVYTFIAPLTVSARYRQRLFCHWFSV